MRRAGRSFGSLTVIACVLAASTIAAAAESASANSSTERPADASFARTEPRRQHATFTNSFFRRLFVREPAELMRQVSEGGSAFVTSLWDDLGARMPAEERVASTGISVEGERIGQDTRILWLTMPPPEAPKEVYFIALVEKLDGLRYYTFEAMNPAERDRRDRQAVLCAWKGGVRESFALTGAPTLLEFKAAVRAHLVADTPPAKKEG